MGDRPGALPGVEPLPIGGCAVSTVPALHEAAASAGCPLLGLGRHRHSHDQVRTDLILSL